MLGSGCLERFVYVGTGITAEEFNAIVLIVGVVMGMLMMRLFR